VGKACARQGRGCSHGRADLAQRLQARRRPQVRAVRERQLQLLGLGDAGVGEALLVAILHRLRCEPNLRAVLRPMHLMVIGATPILCTGSLDSTASQNWTGDYSGEAAVQYIHIAFGALWGLGRCQRARVWH